MLSRYLGPAACWDSVTPVVLPGHDDPGRLRRRLRRGVTADEQARLLATLDARTESLLRRAIVHAGLSPALAAQADLSWRDVSFWPGGARAQEHAVPPYLRPYRRLHLRVRWRDGVGAPLEIDGPLCLGGGRFLGLGLLAAADPVGAGAPRPRHDRSGARTGAAVLR